jgi:hypothetical protein
MITRSSKLALLALAAAFETMIFAQAPPCPPQVYTNAYACPNPVFGLNSIYWGGPFPVTITNEIQVTTTARSTFNLAWCRDPLCYYYNLAVYHNGTRLTPDVQYGRSGYTVHLTTPAAPGDTMLFDYSYTFQPLTVVPPGTVAYGSLPAGANWIVVYMNPTPGTN